MTAFFAAGVYLLFALMALFMIATATTAGFAVHGVIILVAAILAAVTTLGRLRPGERGEWIVPDRSNGGYHDEVVKAGIVATVGWTVVALLVGVIAAAQLAWPALNLGLEWTTFGRIRPVHTSGVIFALCGNVLIASSFWVVQRTCRARLFAPGLAWFVFWGYQLFLVLAASGYVFGITQSKEYAEPEWYVDLWLTIVWVAYFIVYVGTIVRRKEPHIYVANWFYMSFIITVGLLHIVNNLSVPVGFSDKSYMVWGGVQDALTQWWYGHNAVAFILTVPFLALMYYFIPKQAGKPIYSYRLSTIHFWSLIFLYIWAGPHHLHFTALPDWAQILGMVFSVMLWMPSWGGMINGLMTLDGAWDKIRTDPIIRMFVAALAFYGMATFEGPLLSIRTVNALSHYTDWTIGHVHAGALGWNGLMSFACIYYLTPRLFGTKRMYSMRMINWHFWMAMGGIVLYAASMWVAGIMQGLMWREFNAEGYLVYAFAEVVAAMHPYYIMRTLGGVLYLAGAVLMAWNFWMTTKGRLRVEEPLDNGQPYDPAADRPEQPAAQPAE